MYRRLITTSLLLALIIGLPTLLEAQAPKKAPKDPAAPTDSATLPPGEFSGTLKTTPGTDRTFTVTVEVPQLVPSGARPPRVNPRGGNNNLNRVLTAQNQFQQAIQKAQTARNAQQRNQAMQQAQRAQMQMQQAIAQLQQSLLVGAGGAGGMGAGAAPPGYKWNVTKQDIEFQAEEEVKVRTTVLPEQFDDKGNIKKYTKTELDELKGKDKTLPGYESALEKLETGQKVRVTLVRHKTAKPAADKGKDKDPDKEVKDKEAKVKDKDKDAEMSTEKKEQVKLIVILSETPGGAGSPGEQPKKKKNN